ncbi:glycoside hydrolase family 10 protein [Actinomadura parmotrematis]|uniref:Family 10 glycosylhydrolase n=1 Tax=Actinomadura parmotrematis TaxID=2864039 RepID=A0ABS7FQS8_9ACTN|nr:family 10 glycosylhydrolase [Actinomadura parmotrematis]MBW8482758.1 family 10 glycosylhydrolase [Actinomadura parmotrematis]
MARRRTPQATRTITSALTAGVLAAGALAACGGPGAPATDPVRAGAAAECPALRPAADPAGRDLRGMWIATVANIDWPRTGDKTVAQQQASYRRLLDTAQALNLNAVFVQIRPNGDAFYPSPYEPWSQWLTGTPGKNPGYDVLDFLLREAHARNLEFHAWFNPYRISRDTDLKKLPASSPAREHPDWVREYGGGLWYDPGLPQVRDLVTKAVLDVVTKYDIDAVHFDDYFYPYPEDGDYPDQATYKTYGHGQDKADWRRANVDTLVRDLSRRIHAAKSWVRFGISPFGVWRNKSNDPAGSATKALQSYDDQYADTRKWIKQGWIDYVVPQLYWPIGDPRADYTTLTAWWSQQVAGTATRLYIGQAAYRVGEDATWRKPAELSRHLAVNARHPQIGGDVYFSAADLAANRRGFATRLQADHYSRPALPPPSGTGNPPPAVQQVHAEPAATGGDTDTSTGKGVTGNRGAKITWRVSEGATSYAVYRRDGSHPGCTPLEGGRLVASIRGGGIIDPTAAPGKTYTYTVTALDRLHHESAPARAVTVTVPKPNRG